MARLLIVAAVMASLLLAVWTGWALYLPELMEFIGFDKKFKELGMWGDSFGGLNVLVGTLAFSAVTATLYFQYLQNKEGNLDRHKQKFEDTFFELLHLLRETREAVEYKFSTEYQNGSGQSKNDKMRGTQAFKAGWEEFWYWIDIDDRELTKDKISDVYYQKTVQKVRKQFRPIL